MIQNRTHLLHVQELAIEVAELCNKVINCVEAKEKALSKIKDQDDYEAFRAAYELAPSGRLTATLRRRTEDLRDAMVELRRA